MDMEGTNLILVLATMLMYAVGSQLATGIGHGDPASGCMYQCGDEPVPYPFGIGPEECYQSKGFKITCDNRYKPFKLFQGNVEVSKISIESHQMIINQNISYRCYTNKDGGFTMSLDLQESPYRFSTDNVFTAIGCDTWAFINGTRGRYYTGGCITMCQDKTNVINGSCTGMGCCQTYIPQGLRKYKISFMSGNNHSDILSFNPCSYAFLVAKDNYTFKTSDLSFTLSNQSSFPVVLDWAIGNETCEDARKNKTSYACVSKNSVCVNSTNDPGYYCNCSKGYHGNPYLQNGCQDINECKDPKTYPCNGTCINQIGSYQCICPVGTTGDPTKYGCNLIPDAPHSSVKAVIVIPVAVLTSLLAIALCVWIYTLLQKRKLVKLSEQHFKDNGGEELHQRLSASGVGNGNGFKLFTREEMEKATLNYDKGRVLGKGGQGVVYKGILPDDTIIAVKRSIKVDKEKVKDFVNEIAVLSQINHRNVVKLWGCCLETEEPLLVYEYVPNGTLSHHIRNSRLNWEIRLKIAAETASALGSLHSSSPIRVIHRDVKSCNVLLDLHYTAKVADFGTAVLVPENKVLIAAMIMGTLGYLDPEYLQTQRLTEKSDVYSFGVILVELLTGLEPYSSSLVGEEQERSLVKRFASCMKANMLDQILDSTIAEESAMTQIKKVALLAMQCLSMKGEDRPTMVEVATELNGLRGNVTHPWVFNENVEEKESLMGSDKGTTSFPPNVNYAGDMFKTVAMENLGRGR